jgi:hypothetical protein
VEKVTSGGELKPIRRGDLVLAAAIIVIGVIAASLGYQFPKDARMWPALAIAITVVGAVFAAVQVLRGGRSATGEEEVEPLADRARAVKFIVVVVIFDLLLSTLGFVTAAAFALIAVPYLLEERRWLKIMATGLVFLVAAYLLFNKLVHKSLPPDWFWS